MTGHLVIPTTAQLLRRFDAARPRSQQTELGMSELGGCRRRAGYTLDGHPRGQVDDNGLQAILGTAIDDAVTEVLQQMIDTGELPPGSMVQPTVTFAGLTGHPDLYAPPVLRDTKSVGFGAQLDRMADHGPPRRHIWQVFLYAAALITAGHDVRRLELDYIDRGSGRDWQWSAPFTVEPVREALAWLEYVRETETDLLPRDHDPESQTCIACPFRRWCWEEAAVPGRDLRSVLYLDDPDPGRWAAKLRDARARKAAAEADEKAARGALDAIRPNDIDATDLDVGLDGKLMRFRVGRKTSLDRAQIEADYAEAGRTPPVTVGHPVSVVFVNPPKPKRRKEGT